MRILITGGNGMLATAINDKLKKRNEVVVKSIDKDTCDITNESNVNNIFSDFRPNIVINCAAYTNVDKSEIDNEKAFDVNANAVLILAKYCFKQNIKLIHFSTDYVFSGDKHAYLENDDINPINIYGGSKAKGEQYIQEIMNDNWYIIRTAWLYGPNGKNFVETMLKLAETNREIKVVNDQYGSPTLTIDLAQAVESLIFEKYSFGVYHITNSGSCSWYEFAQEIFLQSDIEIDLIPVNSSEFPRAAKRPHYSILTSTKFPKLQDWKKALKYYLNLKK